MDPFAFGVAVMLAGVGMMGLEVILIFVYITLTVPYVAPEDRV